MTRVRNTGRLDAFIAASLGAAAAELAREAANLSVEETEFRAKRAAHTAVTLAHEAYRESERLMLSEMKKADGRRLAERRQ